MGRKGGRERIERNTRVCGKDGIGLDGGMGLDRMDGWDRWMG